jgi:parallel beta-helix repeat protein
MRALLAAAWPLALLVTPSSPTPALAASPVEPASASTSASACPSRGTVVTPKGQRGEDIIAAVRRAGDGGTVLLSGAYTVDSTIRLRDGSTLCSNSGATLTWTDLDEPGPMISALRASGTTIKNLILDGRGIIIKGSGHVIDSNLIRRIAIHSTLDKRWGERHGVMVADNGEGIVIQNNVFSQIADTGIMAYGLNKSNIAGNEFQNVSEGIHLWTVSNTTVHHNTGSGYSAMAIEVQGENLPGLVVEYNRCKGWQRAFEKGAYAMSVVAGRNAIVRYNTIEGSAIMGAGLEVGGEGPRVSANTLIDTHIMITDTPDAIIEGNQLTRGSIVKDINQAKRGTLLIQGNTITDAPALAIFAAPHWTGHEQVTISGNRISKTINSPSDDFIGILATRFEKKPMVIRGNQIVIRSPNGIKPKRATCIGNSGYQGDLSGMVVDDNTCDGGGVASFSDSNSLGGHIGVRYNGNKLINLVDTIRGESGGYQASRNELTRVSRDQARLAEH